MRNTLINTWALLLGMGLIMTGNGLQGTLLGIRATMEGFNTSVTGLVMSGYFIGLIIGCYLVPKVIANAGHVRVFGALASLASTSILIHGVWVDPFLWWAMRLITGFSYAGLYIVSESWLNDASDNGSRGQLLSIYMIISLGGLAGGQFLLNIASPGQIELFILTSLLISLAVVPILMSATRGPTLTSGESVSIMQLYRVSPLGVVGMFASGVCLGAFFGLGSVYTTNLGFAVKDVAWFMSAMIIGGFLCQYPLGWLSDRYGRRLVISSACGIGGILATYAALYPNNGIMFFVMALFIGGTVMPLYALCSAHVNDYLSPIQMVAASGTLVLLSALGATVGSPVTAFAMDHIGPSAYYGTMACTMFIVVAFTLWRSTRRAEQSEEDRGDFVLMASTPLSASLNPDIEMDVIEEAASEDWGEIEASFDDLVTELAQPDEKH